MTRLNVLRPEQHAQWQEVLAQSFQYDFYHLPGYHALAEQQVEGDAHLFVFTEGHYFIAIPLLLRSMESVPGLAHSGEGLRDATSVYGYAGPIASHAEVPAPILRNFHAALQEIFQAWRIVAVFSRLHPLLPQWKWLAGLGTCLSMGQTISIDLTLPVEVQRTRYRRDHRYGINKLRRCGVTCLSDQHHAYLDEFIHIYYETMHRVHATEAYFFDHTYFERLISAPEENIQLFVCRLKDRIICGGLFTLCDGIVQYHLSGTLSEFLELAPMKLLLDTVRLWANEHKARVLHLGGGVGARKDSLFEFKAGFSDRRHEFAVWHWVLLPEIYNQLCREKIRWNEQNGLDAVAAEYFPVYRCPALSIGF